MSDQSPNFFENPPASSSEASDIMSQNAPAEYAKTNARDDLNDKEVRRSTQGSNDPLAPYRYLGDDELAQQMYEADKNQAEEAIKNLDPAVAHVEEAIKDLESRQPISSATQDAITHMRAGLKLLNDRVINAASQTLLETGNDAAETAEIKEEI